MPKTRRLPLAAVLSVLLLLSLAGNAFQFLKLRHAALTPSPDQQQADDEARALVEEVGKLIALPEGEVPTVATVSDPDKLKSQSFFSKAEVGDKVLIYAQAKQAILYRPSEHRVIQVATINAPTPEPTAAPKP